jgi:aromatic-amino-acid transaminase
MTVTATASPFSEIPQAPPDPILGLTEQFNADQNPDKVNLGVGVYQDGTGKVPVLQTVREAEERWHSQESTKSYLPIDGAPAYNKEVQKLLLGADSPVIAEGRAVTVEALGGTGGLKVGADFLKRFFPDATVLISNPSWENHRALFEAAGFPVDNYPYYDAETHGLDFESMMEKLRLAPARSVVVLHAACHNPTGVDLTPDQWRSVVELFQTSELVPFLDFAYQGFGEGIEEDAFAVRAFAEAGIPCLIASSFSKSFSLYRERVGALTVLTSGPEESKRVLSQLKRVIRTNYSNPPSHGGQVVALILGDPELRARWEQELAEMRDRIWNMRALFVRTLGEKGVERDFSFIERQRGMFSYSGIPVEAVHRLRSEYSLYIVDSGRICVAAMNERNIPVICDAIAQVL